MNQNTIEILNPAECTGCGACDNCCPVNAITMHPNHEGFFYPHIQADACIHCGKCAAVCPALNYSFQGKETPDCYAVMANTNTRMKSSSGGAFTLLANYTFQRGGVICGAKWNDDWTVSHAIISSPEELDQLRGSKYYQSNTGHVYQEIKQYLDHGRTVLFTGCPCQVAGLQNYLKTDYQNLITADLICHGTPSFKAWDAFVKEKSNGKAIRNISFRDKTVYRWSTTILLEYTDGSEYRQDCNESEWYQAFSAGLMFRPSCYTCPYSQSNRTGDFTIGDFWGIWKLEPSMNDFIGTSVVLVNTEKGESIFKKVFKPAKVKKMQFEEAARFNTNLQRVSSKHPNRENFYNYLNHSDFSHSLDKAKKDHYDVGIVGYWYATNYGSILTYYALHKALEYQGYRPVLIDRPEKERDPEGEQVISRIFLRNHVNISPSVKWHELDRLNNLCDSFIVGSDQVWTRDAIRHMGYFFFLSFISDDKKKIAYAPSFGKSKFEVLPDTLLKVKYYLSKFDAISSREDIGVNICQNTIGVPAQRVLDPVFLVNIEDYDSIAAESNVRPEGDYILTYILDPTPDKCEMLRQVSKKMHLPLINLLDGRFNTFERNKAKMEGLENIPEGVMLEDWIYYFKHAKFVLTDSHHGLAVAIIYHKPFICYSNFGRGQSRFTSLLTVLGLMDKLIYRYSDIEERPGIYDPIDYDAVQAIIDKERVRSEKWLSDALTDQTPKYPSGYDILNRTLNDTIHRTKADLQKQINDLKAQIEQLKNN